MLFLVGVLGIGIILKIINGIPAYNSPDTTVIDCEIDGMESKLTWLYLEGYETHYPDFSYGLLYAGPDTKVVVISKAVGNGFKDPWTLYNVRVLGYY